MITMLTCLIQTRHPLYNELTVLVCLGSLNKTYRVQYKVFHRIMDKVILVYAWLYALLAILSVFNGVVTKVTVFSICTAIHSEAQRLFNCWLLPLETSLSNTTYYHLCLLYIIVFTNWIIKSFFSITFVSVLCQFRKPFPNTNQFKSTIHFEI